jgi:hypothetical protein
MPGRTRSLLLRLFARSQTRKTKPGRNLQGQGTATAHVAEAKLSVYSIVLEMPD